MQSDLLPQASGLSLREWVTRFAKPRAGHYPIAGLAGSVGVYAAVELCAHLEQLVWYVAADAETALAAASDATFYGEGRLAKPIVILPSEDAPWAQVHPDRRAYLERVGALARLSTLEDASHGPKKRAGLVITTAAALKRKVAPPEHLRHHSRWLRVGNTVSLDVLVKELVDEGYLRVPLVEDPGTLAQRGGLIDVWPPGSDSPYRLELDGDTLTRIRPFDPETQRTLETPGHANLAQENREQENLRCFVPPCTEAILDENGLRLAARSLGALADAIDFPSNKTKHLVEELLSGHPFFGSAAYAPAFAPFVPLTEYLSESTPLLLEDAVQVRKNLREEETALWQSLGLAPKIPQFPFEAWALSDEELAHELARLPVISLLRLAQRGHSDEDPLGFLEQVDAEPPSLSAQDHTELGARLSAARKQTGAASALDPLVETLEAWISAGFEVTLTARATTQVDRLEQLLGHRGIKLRKSTGNKPTSTRRSEGRSAESSPRVTLALGSLSRGVVLPTEPRVYLTEEEIFGERSHRHRKRERATENSLEDLRSLMPGDYVVHVEHGIGRYLGLERRTLGSTSVELIAIEYQAGKLYLPIYRLNQIAKYSGQEASPKLDRLGGLSFAKTKAKVQRRVRQMADELLKLYSERLVTERPPLPPRDDDYATFEATFPFEETRDQAAAIADVLSDLESPKVMDRLVCGDVGFGKTEVALRAAYRVAASGRQVALLCPTTVLAQQHVNHFRGRLAEFGLEVRGLSRFTRPAEAKETLLGLKRGNVDLVVGTHRLLSKDIDFKQLGLLIVDEEQRFGVAHKERIKQLRGSVDVLTLSATPIPRTLQMAVGGLRDLSMISTPPLDRRSIRTIIAKAEDTVLVDAISRELERGGQIFYVYNRVAGLEERAARIAQLFPQVSLAVAHGQMPEDKLERSMMRFVEGDAQILISTAIIENGIDISRANTLIVDRADLFGLSQLYQLRGRVGRSRERAYCYLLVPSLSELSADARSRLEAIERFSELGSGLKVAALDLELRGAGDFLGGEQSGFVASVGFELFCHLLRDAAGEARGEPVRDEVEPELSFDVETLIPEDYIADVGIRLSLYKRLSSASSATMVDEIAWAMEDRFGPAPTEARLLIQLMRDKTILRRLSVLSCEATATHIRLRVREDTPLDPARISTLMGDPNSGYRLSPDGTLTAKRRPSERCDHGLSLLARVLEELEALVQQSQQ